MRVILYLEKQADMGETCHLAIAAGMTLVECSSVYNAIVGDIDSRKVNELYKVKGVAYMQKGQYASL
jgi:hypothetical protein